MSLGVAVITGASGAIGAATCALLSDVGYLVVGLDMCPFPEESSSPSREHVVIDLTQPVDVKNVFDYICTKYGKPVILVNNAGIYRAYEFLATTVEQFDAVYGANVRTAFLCTQEFARRAAPSASVVNVASISGQAGSPDVAYGASKGAVIALTKSMSLALAERGIRVNAVAPGLVRSAMSDRIPEARYASYVTSIPMSRLGEPAEIGRVIVALATQTGSYMTGAVVDVNGGLH